MTNDYATVWAAKWLVSLYRTAVHSTLSLTRMLPVRPVSYDKINIH